MKYAERLIDWYTDRKRELPWRQTSDPYPVWISEIILQQTRVDQGLPYWERFMKELPRLKDLALAEEEQVLRLWQGLGYYSRARNLHQTAKHIHFELEGKFPTTYEELLKLKGVGPYTAAAIASICYQEPRPVVDGNVFRFASRFFGIEADISKASTRKIFEATLSDHISKNDPGAFNQAMMEIGATVCTPQPNCDECPFQKDCFAKLHHMQLALPVKTKNTKVQNRFINYIVLTDKDMFWLKRREGQDVWKGLYDFYAIEGERSESETLDHLSESTLLKGWVLEEVSPPFKHILSHQKIMAKFFLFRLHGDVSQSVMQKMGLTAFSIEEMLNLPKPKLIVNYLNQKGIN